MYQSKKNTAVKVNTLRIKEKNLFDTRKKVLYEHILHVLIGANKIPKIKCLL